MKIRLSRRQPLQMSASFFPTANVTACATPRRILILGGTGFLGPALVEAARSRGHTLTLFNRGGTRPGLFPGIEKRLGDRDPRQGDGLTSLETGEWDAVIDASGFYPRMVGASARLLAPRVGHYVYLSSVSAYRYPCPLNGDEDSPLAVLADAAVEDMGKNFAHYGGLKAACEAAVEAALPGRTTVVRPGFIVGPDDPSGRFTYWPARLDRGGEIAVPGAPTDPLQLVDVRDLAEWLVLLVETRTTGRFNAVGPQTPMTWGRVVAACQQATRVASTPVWIPGEFVARQDGLAFPIWVPCQGDTEGFHTWQNARAVQAGLRFRPVEETVADTLAWYRGQLQQEGGRSRLAFSVEQEAEMLKRWKASLAG